MNPLTAEGIRKLAAGERSPAQEAIEPSLHDASPGARALELEAERLARRPFAQGGDRQAPPLRPRGTERGLAERYRALAAAIRREAAPSPAALWLVENFATIAQAREEVDALLDGSGRALPRSAEGPFAGYPRIFELMHAFAAHAGGGFDPAALRRFVDAYQRVAPLRIAELWALPTALRSALLEELGRLAGEIAPGRADRLAAPTAVDVAVRRLITSLRAMAGYDWVPLFERVSLVDRALAEGSAFESMDFATRDRYRHAIEDLARGAGRSELDVVRDALRRASFVRDDAWVNGEPRPATGDPGYYLISDGRPRFEKEIGYRGPVARRLIRAYVSTGTVSYLATIGLLTAFFLALPLLDAHDAGMRVVWLVLLGLLAAVPASDLAIALVNRAVVELLGPRRLPRLALRDGVPPELKTIVVMPTLLTSESEIAELIARLEVHYLANPDAELRFALVSDWLDAGAESAPADDRLLAAARAGIRRLNDKHPLGGREERFLLFHRRRRWNPAQGVWMGWERKRGKLHELNRLLRGAGDTSFLGEGGEPPAAPAGIRYVITLDSDTRLPRGAAAQLIGTLAHPLNRPVFDPAVGRVVDGYAILQPRVTPSLPTERAESFFQRTFSGPAGVDPYASAVSDVYQDLFGEGSYTGKGIYEIDAFESALCGRTPENALLSHDLFEGLFARAGLVSDIELFEEFPASYEVSAARQHRWARGDWQLLPWILRSRTPGAVVTALPVIARWKMVDNLRRTLSAPAAFATLVAAWTLPNSAPAIWTQLVLVAMALPVLIPAAIEAGAPRAPVASYLRALARSVALGGAQFALNVAFLAHQAWSMADAIARTLFRLAISRRSLLEWVAAARVKAGLDRTLRGTFHRMRGAVALGAGAAVLISLAAPERWPTAWPFVLMWILSPLIARVASEPVPARAVAPPSADDRRDLRATARLTWRFFETVVGAEDHHLPPDNLQEDPAVAVAHRTSPTNIGLYLLSAVTAHDLGWIGALETVERLERTLATAARLDRFRGHLLNWYDTRTLEPLEPRYVSTVDSGNLAGHLITLANACREIAAAPPLGAESTRGIEDAVGLLRSALDRIADDARPAAARARLDGALDRVASLLAQPLGGLRTRAAQLRRLRDEVDGLVGAAQAVSAERGRAGDEGVLAWAEAVRAAVLSHCRDADLLVPWLALLDGALGDVGRDLPAGVKLVQALSSGRLGPAGMAAACEALADQIVEARPRLGAPRSSRARDLDALIAGLDASASAARELDLRLADLAARCRRLAQDMEFDFLLHEDRQVFSIGYRVDDGALDDSAYDLLASEARLTSFVAIAKGDVPAEHWFRMARPAVAVELEAALVSWSGSMFEYLMPELVMDTPPGSLLERTGRLAVRRQQTYAASRGVVWGISESAYNRRDAGLVYQYSSFGVPDLGLDRRLGESLVIAPYATGLAAMIDAGAARRNFAALARAGARGALGFYEALDFTPSRLLPGQPVAVVRAYMSHHQGMTLVALGNVLGGNRMRARFHAEPMVQATELLLHERPPQAPTLSRERVGEVAGPSAGRPARTGLAASST